MDETKLNILIALAEACEGQMDIHFNGIQSITTNDDLEVRIHMDDGQALLPEQCDPKQLDDAVFHWRQEHPAFFQRVIGAMM